MSLETVQRELGTTKSVVNKKAAEINQEKDRVAELEAQRDAARERLDDTAGRLVDARKQAREAEQRLMGDLRRERDRAEEERTK